MNERLELIIKKFKRTLEKYPTCDECDIRRTCGEIDNIYGLCIMNYVISYIISYCDMLLLPNV